MNWNQEIDVKELLVKLSHLFLSARVYLFSSIQKLAAHFFFVALGVVALSILILIWPASKQIQEVEETGVYRFHQEVNHEELLSKGPMAFGQLDFLWTAQKLKSELVWAGYNQRPDKKAHEPEVVLYLKGSSDYRVTLVGEPLFVKLKGQQLIWSSEADSVLSFTLVPEGGIVDSKFKKTEALVRAEVSGTTSESLHDSWMIHLSDSAAQLSESARVDSALFSRANAKWYGEDMFLRYHGGDELEGLARMQRIEFGKGSDYYASYVGEGGFLVFDQGHWESQILDHQTRGKPLLRLISQEEEQLKFEAWGDSGHKSTELTLLKVKENWNPKVIIKQIKLVGVRSKEHVIVDIEGQRFSLRPFDWLLREERDWRLLKTVSEVDDYVAGDLKGDLLIFLNLSKEGGGWNAKLRLYSPSRANVEEVVVNDKTMKVNEIDKSAAKKSEEKQESNEGFVDEFFWPDDEDQDFDPPIKISPEEILEILRPIHSESIDL